MVNNVFQGERKRLNKLSRDRALQMIEEIDEKIDTYSDEIESSSKKQKELEEREAILEKSLNKISNNTAFSIVNKMKTELVEEVRKEKEHRYNTESLKEVYIAIKQAFEKTSREI